MENGIIKRCVCFFDVRENTRNRKTRKMLINAFSQVRSGPTVEEHFDLMWFIDDFATSARQMDFPERGKSAAPGIVSPPAGRKANRTRK